MHEQEAIAHNEEEGIDGTGTEEGCRVSPVEVGEDALHERQSRGDVGRAEEHPREQQEDEREGTREDAHGEAVRDAVEPRTAHLMDDLSSAVHGSPDNEHPRGSMPQAGNNHGKE